MLLSSFCRRGEKVRKTPRRQERLNDKLGSAAPACWADEPETSSAYAALGLKAPGVDRERFGQHPELLAHEVGHGFAPLLSAVDEHPPLVARHLHLELVSKRVAVAHARASVPAQTRVCKHRGVDALVLTVPSCHGAAVPKAKQPIDLALAAVLKHEREARGESQETLAYKAGLSSSSLGAIELGRSSPAWSTVRAIIAAWGMTLGELAAEIERGEV